MNLEPFRQIIRDQCQLAFKPESLQHLEEALNGRMRATGLDEAEDYLRFLQQDPQEITHLINLLTNNETYFLREGGHYRLLTQRLFPRFQKQRLGSLKPVKIISAGCSSGEEPYSLLISLIEAFGEEVLPHVEIIGLDIDEEALHRARLAIYGAHSFRGVPKEIQERYFGDFMGNRYVLKEDIRQHVQFIRHNLVEWPYPKETREADLVFYRNVSIYYQHETQKCIFENLARLLAPHGALIMSSVETSQHDLGIMHLSQENELFHFTRQAVASSPKNTPGPSGPPKRTDRPPRLPDKRRPLSEKPRPRKEPEFSLEKARDLAMNQDYLGALNMADSVIQSQTDCVEACCLKAGVLLQLNRMEEAESLCMDSIKLNEWSPEPYLLLGLAAEQRYQSKAAAELYKKAVYLEPACWLAHFHLADCYSATGHPQDARREYQVTLQLLGESGIQNHGLTFFPFDYSAEQMMDLCRRHLNRLDEVNT